MGVVKGWPRLLGEGWVLWKGALAIGGRTAGAATAIVTSALMSDYQNYVCTSPPPSSPLDGKRRDAA